MCYVASKPMIISKPSLRMFWNVSGYAIQIQLALLRRVYYEKNYLDIMPCYDSTKSAVQRIEYLIFEFEFPAPHIKAVDNQINLKWLKLNGNVTCVEVGIFYSRCCHKKL